MICVAVTVGSNFNTVYSLNQQYGIFVGLLVLLFVLCSSATKVLAKLNMFCRLSHLDFRPDADSLVVVQTCS